MTKIFSTLITILLFAVRSSASPDDWGKPTNQKAEFYAASDVPKSQITLTKRWHEIAAKAWGNYGPLEFWVVGKSEAVAKKWTGNTVI
jgi:hypothetical protein